jgi:predicted transcriptional regulator of viral defense system
VLRNPKPALNEILDRQQDIVARHQLLAAGVGDMTIYRRVRSGAWQRVLAGVYRINMNPMTDEHRRIAAALFAGPDAQITGLSALHWYGFRHAPSSGTVQVLMPHQTRRRSAGFVVVHRTLEMDGRPRHTELYQLASPARAVIDACRWLTSLRDVRAIMAEAVQRDFVPMRALDEELRRARRSRTALARRALHEVMAGVRSTYEAELRAITQKSKILPPLEWNPPLFGPDGQRLPTPDALIRDVGLAIEVDSREYHAQGTKWNRTLKRGNELTRYTYGILHITPAEIRDEPAMVLQLIEETYLRRKEG